MACDATRISGGAFNGNVGCGQKKKTGPKPGADGPREGLIAMKCHLAYKAWLENFALWRRTNPSQTIDAALVQLAKSEGYDVPAPNR